MRCFSLKWQLQCFLWYKTFSLKFQSFIWYCNVWIYVFLKLQFFSLILQWFSMNLQCFLWISMFFFAITMFFIETTIFSFKFQCLSLKVQCFCFKLQCCLCNWNVLDKQDLLRKFSANFVKNVQKKERLNNSNNNGQLRIANVAHAKSHWTEDLYHCRKKQETPSLSLSLCNGSLICLHFVCVN